MTKAIKSRKKRRMHREQEFRVFVLWANLPSALRGQPEKALAELGFHDQESLEILKIKTMTEFAKKFRVNKSTLTEWQKRVDEMGYRDRMMGWARRITKNILWKLAREALEEGDAARVKLWLQAVEDFVEKSEVQEKVTVTGFFERLKRGVIEKPKR